MYGRTCYAARRSRRRTHGTAWAVGAGRHGSGNWYSCAGEPASERAGCSANSHCLQNRKAVAESPAQRVRRNAARIKRFPPPYVKRRPHLRTQLPPHCWRRSRNCFPNCARTALTCRPWCGWMKVANARGVRRAGAVGRRTSGSATLARDPRGPHWAGAATIDALGVLGQRLAVPGRSWL